MASFAGDAFVDLLDEEDTPAPQFAQTGSMSRGQVLRAQESRAAYAQSAAQEAKDRQLKAQYGTTNREQVLARKATGALEPDFAARAQIDPQWAQQAGERLQQLVKQEDSQKHAGDDRQFMVGEGQHGEPYYTNLNLSELSSESHDMNAARRKGGGHELAGEPAAPVHGKIASDFSPLDLGKGAVSNLGGRVGDQGDPESILFQSKLEKAKSVSEIPKRRDEHAQVVEKVGAKLQDFKRFPTAEKALDSLHKMRQSGQLGKLGVSLPEENKLEQLIVHFAKPSSAFLDDELDRTMYRPWSDGGDKPGTTADGAQPATILNPGGAMPEQDMVEQKRQRTLADNATQIDGSTPRELPRTFQYANGAVATKSKGRSTFKQPYPGGMSGEMGYDLGGDFLSTEGVGNPLTDIGDTLSAGRDSFDAMLTGMSGSEGELTRKARLRREAGRRR